MKIHYTTKKITKIHLPKLNYLFDLSPQIEENKKHKTILLNTTLFDHNTHIIKYITYDYII